MCLNIGYMLFSSSSSVLGPYFIIGRMPFSTDATLLCLGLFFPIVFRIHISRHAISSSVGHAFDCVYGVGCPVCQFRDPTVVFHSDDMSSPCPFRLVYTFYDIPHTILLSNRHGKIHVLKSCPHMGYEVPF